MAIKINQKHIVKKKKKMMKIIIYQMIIRFKLKTNNHNMINSKNKINQKTHKII